jgi:hypothetical protein
VATKTNQEFDNNISGTGLKIGQHIQHAKIGKVSSQTMKAVVSMRAYKSASTKWISSGSLRVLLSSPLYNTKQKTY